MALKVIGAGLGRTGTMSLKAALEILGFGPCYHMTECLPKGARHWQQWINAANASPDWPAIFAGYQSTLDFPSCTNYQALADFYPDAKVILTVRDPERWFESTQETIFAPHWMEYLETAEMGKFMMPHINDHFQNRMHDKDYLIQCFNQHIENVKKNIPAERLFIYEIKQGWIPLCEFLQVPRPTEDFPNINDTQATKDIIHKIISEGLESMLGYDGHNR